MREINQEDQDRAEFLRHALAGDGWALVSTEFGGTEFVAVATVVRDDETGDYTIAPLALLVSDELFASLVDPSSDLIGPALLGKADPS